MTDDQRRLLCYMQLTVLKLIWTFHDISMAPLPAPAFPRFPTCLRMLFHGCNRGNIYFGCCPFHLSSENRSYWSGGWYNWMESVDDISIAPARLYQFLPFHAFPPAFACFFLDAIEETYMLDAPLSIHLTRTDHTEVVDGTIGWRVFTIFRLRPHASTSSCLSTPSYLPSHAFSWIQSRKHIFWMLLFPFI